MPFYSIEIKDGVTMPAGGEPTEMDVESQHFNLHAKNKAEAFKEAMKYVCDGTLEQKKCHHDYLNAATTCTKCGFPKVVTVPWELDIKVSFLKESQ